MIHHPHIINALQTGFPITPRPFLDAAQGLGMTEEGLILAVHQLLKEGYLSRFGPLFNVEQMGGGLTLAAMSIPDAQFDQVVAQVNTFPEVAHNYARDHRFNMWFVLATERQEDIEPLLAQITKQTGHAVFNLPKLAEYRLGFKVCITGDTIDTVPMEESPPAMTGRVTEPPPPLPSATDRAIIAATQSGLSLVPHPYHDVANRVGLTADALLERLEQMLAWGWIRRIGVVPNHYALGLKGNGMSVWDLPDDRVDALGQAVGALGFVSHCYRRPKHLPHWPFNLFVMVHGPDRDGVAHKIEIIKNLLGNEQRGHALLHSSRILKKTGLRLKNREGTP